jgi:hypothetical protein
MVKLGRIDTLERSVQGLASSRDGRSRTAWFSWTDAETGESLRVELWGSPAFLAELESIGFERLTEEATATYRVVLGEETV